MNSKNVESVFSVYETMKDSFRVTRRSIAKEVSFLQKGTSFIGEENSVALSKIDDAEKELDDIMILALFASFERELRTSIQKSLDSNTTKANPTVEKLLILTEDSIERWTVKDMIDALSDIVDENTRSQTKQIYEYRNWVAHGKNKDKLPSIRTDPSTVETVLTAFMIQSSKSL